MPFSLLPPCMGHKLVTLPRAEIKECILAQGQMMHIIGHCEGENLVVDLADVALQQFRPQTDQFPVVRGLIVKCSYK